MKEVGLLVNLKYTLDFTAYSQSMYVESNCNAISFFNEGNKAVTINSTLSIPAGGQFIVKSDMGEMDTTNYLLTFSASDTNPNCVVVRKYYK